MKYKGAAIQYDCHFMDKEKNLAALTNLVRQAAAQGKEAEKLEILLRNRNNATLCELGIGTNYAARLIGVILEDEKAYQTVHIAFGTNVGFGGNNQADCHMDGIIKNPTLYLDDKLVMLDGVFQI